MKFSLDSIHKSAIFFNSYLWAVKFEDSSPNIQKSSGGIGDVMPAQSVTEPEFQIEYEMIGLGNGLQLPIPKFINYMGQIDIQFYDSGRTGEILKIHNFFTEWTTKFHEENTFKDLTDSVKKLYIYKYSKQSDSYELRSEYEVLPPVEGKFEGSMAADLLTDGVSLHIVKVLAKNS